MASGAVVPVSEDFAAWCLASRGLESAQCQYSTDSMVAGDSLHVLTDLLLPIHSIHPTR